MRRHASRFGLLLEVLLLIASLATGGPVAHGVRLVELVVAVLLGGLVLFVAGVFAVGVVQQRQPPYPMQ